MTAIGIVGLMSLFLYAGFSYGFGLVELTREDLRASQILMRQTEAVRLCRWSSLTNCPITFQAHYDPNNTTTTLNGGSIVPGAPVYTCTITTNTASCIPDSAAYKSNMCQVTVTLYWTNYLGKQAVVHSRQMQTQVARYGLQNYIWGSP